MKKENGFTLVELLGVIAILALIVLVAAPPIINQIKKSKNTFDKATLSLIYSAADSYVDNNQNDYPNINDNIYCVTLDALIKSGELKKSVIDIDKDSEIVVSQVIKITVNNNSYDYSLVETDQCEEHISNADTSGASVPELTTGMIPVKWNGTSLVKANVNNGQGSNKWYDYNEKLWANAILTTAESRSTYQNAAPGTVIDGDDILEFLVWIPRYKYQLFNVSSISSSPATINITFEAKTVSKSNGASNGSWLTHPAFTYQGGELDGFWFGKFEATGDLLNPTILPNEIPLTNQRISDIAYTYTDKLNATTNSLYDYFPVTFHPSKNIEWGAVTYLAYSTFGKNSMPANNTTTCTGGCNYITNISQSTTGNIYGVYDMSGGIKEYVMSAMESSVYSYLIVATGGGELPEESSGFDGMKYSCDPGGCWLDSSGGISTPNYQYSHYDKYIYNATLSNRFLGDATGEANNWSSGNSFIEPYASWFVRGNGSTETTKNMFSFNSDIGEARTNTGFRFSLLIK